MQRKKQKEQKSIAEQLTQKKIISTYYEQVARIRLPSANGNLLRAERKELSIAISPVELDIKCY